MRPHDDREPHRRSPAARVLRGLCGTILAVSVLSFTTIAILAIWNAIDRHMMEVAWRSLATLGVLFTASLVSLGVVRMFEDRR